MVTRVHYREGQILRTADLRDEQAYRIQMRRRHNLAHHGWGIVQGLELLGSVAEGVKLSPGMAIDGFGRELFVSQPVVLSPDIFNQVGTERLYELDLWLLYRLTALMPQDFARCREEAVLWLTEAADIDPRCPRCVPEADLAFAPYQDAPDDPARRWPVYLGRISKSNSSILIVQSHRPYVGLIGELVTAPSGQARVQVGSETAGDRNQFVVSIRDESGQWMDRLALKQVQSVNHATALANTVQTPSDFSSQTTIRGDMMLAADNDLTLPDAIVPNPVEESQERGVIFDALPAPLVAAPWQIYRTTPIEGDTKINQLRFEIDNPGKEGNPSHYQFIIGRQEQGTGKFTPSLTISADGTVTIHGDLIMAEPNAQIREGPIQTDLSDARYRDAIIAKWITGVSAAVPTIESAYQSALAVKISELVRSGDRLDYKVTIENTGVAVVSGILVFASLGPTEVGGTSTAKLSFDPGQSIIDPFTLTPGQSMPGIARTITLQGSEVVLAVTAIGVTPIGLTVANSDQKLIP